MKRMILLTGCIVAGVAIAGVSLSGVQAQEASKAEPVALVDTYEIMEMFFEPTFDSLKETVAKEPESRKDWKALYEGAYLLGEAHNLLYFREDDYAKEADWANMTTGARDQTVRMAEAVKAQDYAAIKSAWGAIVESCNSCHEKFAPDGPDKFEP